jgi:hypothetical protein
MRKKIYPTFKTERSFEKPEGIEGPQARAWDYLAAQNGVCRVEQFDSDFEPAGPAIREALCTRFGCRQDKSGDVEIIFLPSS